MATRKALSMLRTVGGLTWLLCIPWATMADTITISSSTDAVVTQSGEYQVQRTLFGNGGHGWRTSPSPAGSDGYAQAGWMLHFSLDESPGAQVNDAVFSWSGLTPQINTSWSELWFIPFNGCVPFCYDAQIQRVDASEYSLITWLRVGDSWSYIRDFRPTGVIDLVGLGLGNALSESRDVWVYGVDAVELNRIYFDREGRNGETNFQVSAAATANIKGSLALNYSPAPAVPEPASLMLFGTGLICAGAQCRRKLVCHK
jgi:hypothetical protein